jgi:hypothetical protein
MAAQHSADNGLALLDYVQDVAAGGGRSKPLNEPSSIPR